MREERLTLRGPDLEPRASLTRSAEAGAKGRASCRAPWLLHQGEVALLLRQEGNCPRVPRGNCRASVDSASHGSKIGR
jgi:hypothetical protein